MTNPKVSYHLREEANNRTPRNFEFKITFMFESDLGYCIQKKDNVFKINNTSTLLSLLPFHTIC